MESGRHQQTQLLKDTQGQGQPRGQTGGHDRGRPVHSIPGLSSQAATSQGVASVQ